MHFPFTKMEGAGNDFILSTASAEEFTPELISRLCHRKFGIGADGIIFVQALGEEGERAILQMRYFNSDGSYAAMCGNGLRCSASFAWKNGLSNGKKKMLFHSGTLTAPAEILDDTGEMVQILLEAGEDFREYREEDGTLLYKGVVGVPHAIIKVSSAELEDLDADKRGQKYRFSPLFAPEGANIDFLSFTEEERKKGICHIRTYERGVEGETLACGTGCASSGIVLHDFFDFPEKIRMICRCGTEIGIDILKECNILKRVLLTGPAKSIFTGSTEI